MSDLRSRMPGGHRSRHASLRAELPGEVKVTMGFLILFAFASFLVAAFTAREAIAGRGGAPRFFLTNLSLLGLYAAVFVGLARRTRWAWWTATVLFGMLAAYVGMLMLRSLYEGVSELSEASFQSFRMGTVATIAAGAFFVAPFVLLMVSRRRYMSACKPGDRMESRADI